jgi:hypothetical protein
MFIHTYTSVVSVTQTPFLQCSDCLATSTQPSNLVGVVAGMVITPPLGKATIISSLRHLGTETVKIDLLVTLDSLVPDDEELLEELFEELLDELFDELFD